MNSEDSDTEWSNIQQLMKESKKNAEEIDVDVSDSEDIVQCISFDSEPRRQQRMSLGTLGQKREELALEGRAIELDDEIEYTTAAIEMMEENFISMFVQCVKQRLDVEAEQRGSPITRSIGECYAAINEADLFSKPYIEWADTMEKIAEEVFE